MVRSAPVWICVRRPGFRSARSRTPAIQGSFRHWAAGPRRVWRDQKRRRSEDHTSEIQSLMRISYAVFCLKKKKTQHVTPQPQQASWLHTTNHVYLERHKVTKYLDDD